MIFKPLRTEQSDHGLIPTTLDNVKSNLRVLDDEEDTLITEYIEASTERIERWLDMCFLFGRRVSYYGYCIRCATAFQIPGRPMHVVESVEVMQDGSYVTLVEGTDYEIQVERLQTLIILKQIVTIDTDVPDPVKITYVLGFSRLITQSNFTFSDPTVTVTATAHQLVTGNPVYVSGADQSEYNGIHDVTVTSADEFTYAVTGSPASPTGTIVIVGPDVPSTLQLAVKRMVAMMYANRGDCSDKCGDVPCVAQSLAKSWRKRIIRTTSVRYGCCC